ncbi:hypothetical protein DYB25_000613 [Aphanomyces astaci]|uniref:Cyclic nucleotide-binding domain-containing protein n=1 Tax=Aphanomyces astaci TaxID=112090 RepID=A0A397DPE9_APHAT|nr:hypothetical protein DYB25_000613 [Aphanomyces astaci]RHY59875.1 hypothetical protein DYB38_001092 [Aphanomyces astaci]RHY65168.1 hypothetical protein DYB30_001288 [Aphanomyces astaci]
MSAVAAPTTARKGLLTRLVDNGRVQPLALYVAWIGVLLGIAWVLAHPVATVTTGELKSRGTYFSENALLVDSTMSDITDLQEYINLEWTDENGCELHSTCTHVMHWIESKLHAIPGVEVYRQQYTQHLYDAEYVNRTNLYAVLRGAPMVDGKESLVLVAQYPNIPATNKNGFSALTVGLAMLRYLNDKKWLAKDVVLLLTDDGPNDGRDGYSPGLLHPWVRSMVSPDLDGYLTRLFTMLRFMKTLATGPSGPHANFIHYNIDAITVAALHSKASSSFQLSNWMRAIATVVRGVSNLEEKFHQSFYFYLLPSTRTFVSIGEYYYPMVLLMLPLFAHTLYIATNTGGLRLAFALAAFATAAGLGVLLLILTTHLSVLDPIVPLLDLTKTHPETLSRSYCWTLVGIAAVFQVVAVRWFVPALAAHALLDGCVDESQWLRQIHDHRKEFQATRPENDRNKDLLVEHVPYTSDNGWLAVKGLASIFVMYEKLKKCTAMTERAMPTRGPSRLSHASFFGVMRSSQDIRSRINTRKLSTSVIMVVQQRQNRWTIDAESTWLSVWNLVLMVAIFHAVFCVSFVLSFQLHDDVAATHVRLDVLECLFVIDIFVNMHTTFYKNGNVVMELWRTRTKYVCSTAFILDLVPLLPLRRCFFLDPVDPMAKFVDLVKLLRLVRLPKCILHVDRLFAKYFAMVKLVKIVAACVAVSHVLACMRGWFYPNQHHNQHRRRLSGSSTAADPWLPVPSTSPGLESFGLLSGLFEGEVPHTINACLLTLVVMFSGVFLFPYICGTFFMISKCSSQHTEAFDAKRNQLKYILAYHRVPADVQQRAIEYIEVWHHEHNTGDALDRQYLNQLTPSVVRDIKVSVYEKMLSHVPLFRPCGPHFIHALVALMETTSVPANYVLCREGDDADAMYFVQTGVLQLTSAQAAVEPKELRKDMYFGELCLVVPKQRIHTVTTATFCVLHALTRTSTAVVLAAYPHWAERIREAAAKMLALDTMRRTLHSPDDAAAAAAIAAAAVVVKRSKWPRLLRHHTIHRHGRRRFMWLICLQAIQLHHAVSIPLHSCFPAIHFSATLTIVNTIADLCLWLDMYANLHLSYDHDAEHIVDVQQCARHYLHTKAPLHVISTLPWWVFAPSYHTVLRLPRLLRLWDFTSQLDEISHHVTLDGPKRTVLLCLLLLITYHVTSCLYFCMTQVDGYSSRPGQDWLPPLAFKLSPWNDTHMVDGLNQMHEIGSPSYVEIIWSQYSHSFYYAASVITSLGRGIEPDSVHQYMFHYLFMVFGFVFMAYIIDEVQKGITASAVEQVAFLSRRSNILWFLQQQHVPPRIHRRVNSFLEFWWSAHRGADVNALVAPLPLQTKRDILSHVCHAVLGRFRLFHDDDSALFKTMSTEFVDAIHIRLYGQGETIFSAGDFANGVYFLVEGRVAVHTTPPQRVAKGMAFGLAAFSEGTTVFYEHTTVALSGCIVAFLPHGGLRTLLHLVPTFLDDLRRPPADTSHRGMASQMSVNHTNSRWPLLTQPPESTAIDPDAPVVLVWEVCMFVAMSYQCIGVPFRMTFGPAHELSDSADSVVMALEILFLLDMVLRLHLGYFALFLFRTLIVVARYYEYGNKVMDRRGIRRRYVRSVACLLDVVAIVPLQVVNWAASSDLQSESWNANKLVRMYKLSSMLSRFEQRFVTLNIQVRLFQLLFYTFFLSHWVGCLWYSFASNTTDLAGNNNATTTTTFGLNPWLPPAALENNTITFQYYAALFWGFGTMSGCSPRNLPTTTVERFFNVFVILVGVFLFSYVLGNLADIEKVVDGNNRDFYAKLSTLRLFLTKYKFPLEVEKRIKHYFFYQTFHSIHQEPILSACLPPSLVTDTRMFLLQPMIDQVNFLRGTDAPSRQAVRMVVSLLVQQLIPRGKIICKQGDVGLEMYFVFAGCLDVLVTETAYGPPPPPSSSAITPLKTAKLPKAQSFQTQLMESIVQRFQRSPVNPAASTRPTFRRSVSMRFSDASSSLRSTSGTVHVKVNEILPGSYFGEASLFSDKPRNANIQARTFCTVYTLSRQHLHAVFNLHPTWKQTVLNIVNGCHNKRQNQQIVAKVGHTLTASVKAKTRAASVVPKVARNASTSVLANINVLYTKTTATVVTQRWPLRALLQYVERIEVQSPLYIRWLQLLSACIAYQALYIPYTICFDVVVVSGAVTQTTTILNVATDLAFLFDMWFRLHLVANDTSVEFYEDPIVGPHSYRWPAKCVDLLSVLPLDYLGRAALDNSRDDGRYHHVLYFLRMNRLAKLLRLPHVLSEITRLSLANDLNFLRKLVAVYVCIIYWIGCLYFCMTYVDGYGDTWHSWLPVDEFEATNTTANDLHRLVRAMYFSTGIFTNTGVTLLPTTVYQYVFVIAVCLFCLFATSYFIGQVSTMFVCLTQHEVEFRINEMYTEAYLTRTPLKDTLRLRLYKYLNYWWHAHRGVRHDDILQELPPEIKGQAIVCLAHSALTTFVTTFFAPLRGEPTELDMVSKADGTTRLLRFRIACCVRLEIYPHNEYVVVEGDIARTMYFVVSGSLLTTHHNNDSTIHRYREGHYFGETNFLTAPSAPVSVKTLRACELLALTATGLVNAMEGVPHFKAAYHMVLKMYGDGHKDAVAMDAIGTTLRHLNPTFLSGNAPTTDRDYWDAFRRFLHLVHTSHAKEMEMDVSASYKFLDCSCCHGATATVLCPICRANFCTGCNFLVHLNTEREAHLDETKPIHVARRLFTMYYFAKRWKLRAQRALAIRRGDTNGGGAIPALHGNTQNSTGASMALLLQEGIGLDATPDVTVKVRKADRKKTQHGQNLCSKRPRRSRLGPSPSVSTVLMSSTSSPAPGIMCSVGTSITLHEDKNLTERCHCFCFRGSAMLVHRTRAKRNPSLLHVLTCAHVACPWRYPAYYPHEWLQHVDEGFVKHTLALREGRPCGKLISSHILPCILPGTTMSWAMLALAHMTMDASRDLALLELKSSVVRDDKSVDPFDLDTAFSVAESEPLVFDGHVQPDETTTCVQPESVAGAYFWLNPTTKQAFASSATVLTQGMCGGAAFTTHGRKVVGLVEGIVPVVENASPAYKTLENHVAIIPRDDLTEFVLDFEAGGTNAELLFTGTGLQG